MDKRIGSDFICLSVISRGLTNRASIEFTIFYIELAFCNSNKSGGGAHVDACGSGCKTLLFFFFCFLSFQSTDVRSKSWKNNIISH